MTTELVVKPEPKYSPLNGRQNPLFWFGDLEADNAADIAVTLKLLLEGKRHTVVAARDGVMDCVHTDNKLEYIDVSKTGGITISDSYGLWFVYAPARFSFKGEQVLITHKSGAGTELQWAFAVQHDPRE